MIIKEITLAIKSTTRGIIFKDVRATLNIGKRVKLTFILKIVSLF